MRLLEKKIQNPKWDYTITSSVLESPCWYDLVKIENYYTDNRRMVVGNGKHTHFWEDVWCGEESFKVKLCALYEISNDMVCTI